MWRVCSDATQAILTSAKLFSVINIVRQHFGMSNVCVRQVNRIFDPPMNERRVQAAEVYLDDALMNDIIFNWKSTSVCDATLPA